MFGASKKDTRSEFERSVDSFVAKQTKKAEKKQKKLRQSIEHELTYGVSTPMFTGEILMGDAQTKIDVVYDTGSDWLVVPDIDCLSCDGTKHDSSGATPVDAASSVRAYGSA